MTASSPGFDSDLRVSPKSIAIALMALSGVIFPLGLFPPNNTDRLKVLLVSALLLALGGMIHKTEDRWPAINRWLAVLVAVALIPLAQVWLGTSGALVLAVIPVALSAALVGPIAATVIAAGETALALLLIAFSMPDVSRSTLVGILLAIWAVLGVMYAIYSPVHQVAEWAWEYYQKAQASLEEARSRRAELEQVMEDLARSNLQLARLNALAQGLRWAADEARTAKEQFVANVSHELRTPLNMIIGFAEMIVSAPRAYGRHIPPALLADLDVILRNSQHLASLIDDVLDLSQSEAGQMALIKEQVAFSEIVEAAATAVRPLFESKGLYLKIELADDLPPVVCDRTRIREVMLNLLSNAGRFTVQGGVVVRASQHEQELLVSVADTGPGIAPSDQDRLFQPFQQLDGSIRRRYGGSGLGLSISKRFVELHDGKLWMESTLGAGTSLLFTLPLEATPTIGASAARWINPDWLYLEHARRSTVPVASTRLRLVVCEAGHSLQELLRKYLPNVDLVAVPDLAKAALELEHTPAQALLINAASVPEALEQLERIEPLPYGTPAIACSMPGASDAAGALGVTDYLVKPISRQMLLAALERLELRGKTILIADDEPDALRLFWRALISAEQGYRVLTASDGQQAWEILRDQRPDALLLDLTMPEMDGFQLLVAKNADPVLRDIPTLVISARDPMGQPIVSKALAVTRGDGLSLPQLLGCVEALSAILSPLSPSVAPAQPAVTLD